MAIDSKIIRIRRGTAADFNVGKTKLVQGEFAVVTDTKEACFAAENGEAVRLATEKDVSQLQEQIEDIKENGTGSGGGTGATSGISPRYQSMVSKFTMSILRGYANDDSPLKISTYDGSNQTTHPKVLYFENGWNGYKYWLAHSPYPSSQDLYENPCISYSNDGITWLDTNIPNPLETAHYESGSKVGHNSDPTLVMNGNTMECWWRTQYTSGSKAECEYIYRRKSTDGINWSDKEEIFKSPDSGNSFLLSPCVIYDENKYKIWVVRGNTVNNCLRYYESTDGTNWTFIRDIKVSLKDENSGYWVWHFDVIKTSKGYEIVGCYRQSGEALPFIYYCYSTDNITYSEPRLILGKSTVSGNFDDHLLYRPSLIYDDIGVKLYYGTMGSDRKWNIGLVEAPTIKHLNVLAGGDGNTGGNTSGGSSSGGDGGDSGESGGEDTPTTPTTPTDVVNVSEMYSTVPSDFLTSFANSTLSEGYINNGGTLAVESGLNLHTTDYLDVSEAVYYLSSNLEKPFLRFSLYDEGKNYLGKKAGAGTLKSQYFIAPNEKPNAKYMRISFNSDTVSDITLKVYKYAKFDSTNMTQVKLDSSGTEVTGDGNDYLTPLLNVEKPFVYGVLENLHSGSYINVFGYDSNGEFVKVIGIYSDATTTNNAGTLKTLSQSDFDLYGVTYVKIGYNTKGGTNFLAVLKEI